MALRCVFKRSWCEICNLWIYKKFSGGKGALKKEGMFICKKYKGERSQTDSFNSTQRHVGKDISKAVPTFQYFADVNGELGGCADATNAHITAVWKTSRQLLPIITNRVMSLRNWASIFSFCMAQCLLYGWEKWSEFNETILPLSFADNDMVLWICSA